MYFLFNENLYESDAMRDLNSPAYGHDNHGCRRQMCLIDLLYRTANGTENIQNATDLSRLTNTNIKQAQIVWDILLKHGVLRQGPLGGYSAKPWMIERGIIGDINKWRRKDGQSGQMQQPTQSQTGYCTDGNKTSW